MYKKNIWISYKENLEQACIFKGKADLLLNILILFFSAYSNVLLVYYGKAIFERMSEKNVQILNVMQNMEYGLLFVYMFIYIFLFFFLLALLALNTLTTSKLSILYIHIFYIYIYIYIYIIFISSQEPYARHRQK